MSSAPMNPDSNDENFVATLEGAGSCFECRYVLPRLVDCAPAYFEKGFVTCKQCGRQVDLWQAALERATRLSVVSHWPLAHLGAARTSFVLPMETGKHYPIELTNYGIPANARILSRQCSPQGGEQGSVTAVEWHPNDPTHRIRGTLLPLLAVPVFEGPLPRVGPVGINITWVRGEASDEWPYLVTAFEAAAISDYGPSLVFAQSAVEISMMPLIENRFRLHVPEKKVKRFTNYSRALNVVLPYLCGEAGLAQMPAAVHDALEKLRDRRNKIIHVGAQAAAISRANAMEGLCAAAFGFEYMRYVRPTLRKEKT
jgi:hypothetical protein